ncbi:hypothetical protein P3X46_017954 [Hevea brasiliensis]|uniref:N-acetyltransferase domain-containing protein n=1 Tax=Hevea brasiliensis TaxID=3981 RepID=A0ABQ9LQH1_HEVBR|nr:hypothetical protein P3X46_017954 [Hevea brasiliensis]
MVVDPLYQGIGLGKAVMKRLVQELLEKGIVNIALPLGFMVDSDGIQGMVYSRKQKKKKSNI